MPAQSREPRDVAWCIIFLSIVAASCGALFYAFQKGNASAFLGILDTSGKQCGLGDVQTQPYLFICPDQQSEFTEASARVCVNTCPASSTVPGADCTGYASESSGALCIPMDPSWWPKFESSPYRAAMLLGYYMSNLSHAWYLLLILAPLMSLLLGLLFLRLLKRSGGMVFWPSLIVVLLALTGMALHRILRYYTHRLHADLVVSIVAISLAALVLALTSLARRSIARSFVFLEAAGECLMDSFQMIIQPILECLKKALLAAVFVLGVFSLMSFRNRLHWTLFLCITIFLLVVFFWLVEFMGTLSRYVMGYLSQEWFYSSYDGTTGYKLLPPQSIVEAYRTGLLYHTGSLCLGALINVALRPLRAVVKIILLLTRRCGCTPMSRQYRWMQYYSDSAYNAIVLDGPGYVDACDEASRILGNDGVQEISWLDDMLLDVQVLGATAISVLVTLTMWLLIRLSPAFTDSSSDRYLDDEEAVLIAVFVVAQLMVWPSMECMAHVAEALLFNYRAGLGGYMGIGAMVTERTGLFEMPECAGGQGFTPFTRHPPKLTQMLQYLNDAQYAH